jgi:hypothetical protein
MAWARVIDKETLIYRYRLLTSSDHQTWKVVYDSSNEGVNGWQEFHFPNPLEARYIRVHGLSNSANDKFQIVQVEAHNSQPPDLDAEIVLTRTVVTESLENEAGDGLPLQAKVLGIIWEGWRISDSCGVQHFDAIRYTAHQFRELSKRAILLRSQRSWQLRPPSYLALGCPRDTARSRNQP